MGAGVGPVGCGVGVFFVKQRTAYGMRISDWSSDVCSSDLRRAVQRDQPAARHRPQLQISVTMLREEALQRVELFGLDVDQELIRRIGRQLFLPARQQVLARSEEHTSELQSLMRISYAVFCLKKKKTLTILYHFDCHSHNII